MSKIMQNRNCVSSGHPHYQARLGDFWGAFGTTWVTFVVFRLPFEPQLDPKERPRCTRTTPERTEREQSGAKRHPHGSKSKRKAAKSLQKGSKMEPKGTERESSRAKGLPKWSQRTIKRIPKTIKTKYANIDTRKEWNVVNFQCTEWMRISWASELMLVKKALFLKRVNPRRPLYSCSRMLLDEGLPK